MGTDLDVVASARTVTNLPHPGVPPLVEALDRTAVWRPARRDRYVGPMDRMWTVAKTWLGLERTDSIAPWTHLKLGFLAGLVFALVAVIWKGLTLALVMLIGWTVVGALNEWSSRRSTAQR